MFRFRGKRKDNGEWVEGYYSAIYSRKDIHHIWRTDLVDNSREVLDWYEIHPHTLSISTGKRDSKGEEIFASFPIDGTMTEGGDVVEILYDIRAGATCNVCYSVSDSQFLLYRIDRNMIYELNSVYSQHFTIIGKQGGGNEIRQN